MAPWDGNTQGERFLVPWVHRDMALGGYQMGTGLLKLCYLHSLTSPFLDLLPVFIYLKYPKSGIFCRRKEVVFRLHECRKNHMVSMQCASVQTNLEGAEKLLFPMRFLCTALQLLECTAQTWLTVWWVSRTEKKLQHRAGRRESAATPSLRCNTAGMGYVPALSPTSRSSNIPLPPSHVNKTASSVQFNKET